MPYKCSIFRSLTQKPGRRSKWRSPLTMGSGPIPPCRAWRSSSRLSRRTGPPPPVPSPAPIPLVRTCCDSGGVWPPLFLFLAGNSSQVSDGAGAVLLMKRSVAVKKGLPILGVFRFCSPTPLHSISCSGAKENGQMIKSLTLSLLYHT